MLYSIKALFFGRGYYPPVDEQACGRVTMVSIDAENRGQGSPNAKIRVLGHSCRFFHPLRRSELVIDPSVGRRQTLL